MSNASDPNRKMVPRSRGFFSDIANRFHLVARLMGDARVSPLLKILPVGTLVYLIVPDLVPFVLDDAMVIWLGTSLFVEMCPQDIVEEHLRLLNGELPAGPQNQAQQNTSQGDVVDGEFFEVDPNKNTRP